MKRRFIGLYFYRRFLKEAFEMKRAMVFLAVFVVAVTGVFGQQYVIRLAHGDPTDVYASKAQAQAVVFASIVNLKSNGRIKVEVYGNGALGAEREIVESVKAGNVEAGIASGPISNFYPDAMVTDIPYLFPSEYIAWKVMEGPFGQKLASKFLAATGMRCLAFSEVGFRNFTNSVRPIKTPADLKGLKIRVMETPLYITMMNALGASPTPVAWTETYTALQTHVVDGEENPIASILMAKLQEVQKYLTLDGHTYGVSWFIINDKFFQKLPTDLQFIVADAAKMAATVRDGMSLLINEEGMKTLLASGMQVYVPTEQELAMFRDATQKPVIDWLKTKIDNTLITDALTAVNQAVATEKQQVK
jgi:tripartite ATP-independent transporter DctP family solute receptor